MPSKPDRSSVFPIVGVGASAGGIEAFTALLKSLPDKPGASFVFILHQDPHHTSGLPEILKRATKMPVQVAQPGTRVEADRVYVAPPDAEVTIENGELQLHKRPAGITLPIDVFFRSLAEDQGGRAISVVLSGSASDGTLGTKVVKGEGGITFAQDDSAKMHGMPRSAIGAGFVDFVQPPEEMAKEIVRIAQHDYVTGEAGDEDRLPEDDVMTLLKLVRSAHDIDLTHYKPSTIKRRIRRRMTLRKVHTVRDYLRVIREDPGEIEQLYGDIFIRVTGFFRDPEVFQALEQQVFPELLRDRRQDDPVRVWIPGCATGEEVYSIGISLLETATNGSFFCPAQIFGTDVSEPAIAQARSGIYPESIAGEVSAERLRRFFTRVDNGYRVNKAVRDCCIFARQNVTQDPPFSRLDLISCRNVMIYFGSALQRKVLSIFHFALRPNGFLLLGTAETIGDFADLFAAVDKKHRIYRKKSAINRPNLDFDRAVPSSRIHAEEERMTPLNPALREADRVLLARFSPPGVLINENMEVLQFRGHTSRFLEPAPGTASFNLMKMAREGLLGDLRAAIREVRKSESPARREGVHVKFDEHDLTINLEVIPVRGPSNERFHLVLFEEPATPAQKGPQRKAKKGQEPVKGKSRQSTRLKRELEATREYLQTVIEEQEGMNEELQSANEEIQSSNEELQSTNEELETAKEELQSTNEELTTLNDELEDRNRQLETLSNDLTNLLTSVEIPIVMLDRSLRLRQFNPVAQRSLNLIPTDIGRPISDLKTTLQIENLDELIGEVVQTLEVREIEVKDRSGRLHSLRIRPYRTIDDKIDGAVLVLVDLEEFGKRRVAD